MPSTRPKQTVNMATKVSMEMSIGSEETVGDVVPWPEMEEMAAVLAE